MSRRDLKRRGGETYVRSGADDGGGAGRGDTGGRVGPGGRVGGTCSGGAEPCVERVDDAGAGAARGRAVRRGCVGRAERRGAGSK